MTRVEVVVGGEDAPAVRDLIVASGARGFTSVSGVSGLGHDGFHQGGLLFNDRDTQAMIVTVVPDEDAAPVIDGIRRYLRDRPGVMFVSEAWVARPEHFS